MQQREVLAASVLAGAACGALDALLALATNPDPGATEYVLGLVCGPILLSVAWAVVLGSIAAHAHHLLKSAWAAPATTDGTRTTLHLAGSTGDLARTAARAVALVWLASMASEAAVSERSLPEILLVLATATSAALGVAAAATSGAHALAGTSAWRRRAGWATITIGAIAAIALALPSGDLAFRPDDRTCEAAAAASSAAPNIVLLSVDTLRADAARSMHAYRRLADRGIEFTSYVVPAPWTLPSIASLLTGLPPDRHGAGRSLSSRSVIMKTPVSSEVTGLAERLRVAGHHTQAIVTNPFLTPAFGIDRGFCGFENLSMRTEALRGLGATSLMRVLRLVAPGATLSDRADDVREAAQAWLATPPREPFFLWVHFLDPHAPYGDRAGASTSLTLDLRALHSRRGFEEPFSAIAVLRSGEYRPSSEERARIVDLYRADVSFVDEQLVKLLDFLDARGLFERTVIVLTSDHGEEFWDHGRVEHGHSLHEEVVHVPLVLSLPGAARARVDHRLATAIDVAPTLARLAGLAGAPWPGSDLLIADPPHERAIQLGRLLFGEEWTGVRTPTTKYLRSAHGSERIFDLANDPAELHDRASAEPELLARLRAVAPGHAGAELAESDPAREGAPAATLAMSRASNPAAESGARRH